MAKDDKKADPKLPGDATAAGALPDAALPPAGDAPAIEGVSNVPDNGLPPGVIPAEDMRGMLSAIANHVEEIIVSAEHHASEALKAADAEAHALWAKVGTLFGDLHNGLRPLQPK